MEDLRKNIILFFGELLGKSDFFLSKYPDSEIVPLEPRKREKFIYMPLASIIISVSVISIMCLAQKAVNGMFYFVENNLQWSSWSSFKECVMDCLDVFPSLSSIIVYMILYEKSRKVYETYFMTHDSKAEKWGIYVWDDISNEYVLSENWLEVRTAVKWLVVIDIILVTIFHMIKILPIHNVLQFRIIELIPVAIIVMLFEVLFFLGNTLKINWNWFSRKKTREKSTILNLFRLKVRCIEIARKDKQQVTLEEKTNDIKMGEEVGDMLNSYVDIDDPQIQYLRKYLQERKGKNFYHTHYIDTVARLIQGENIFIATPFYFDIGICIFFPVYMSLLRKEKALIMVEDSGNLEQIAEWIKAGIEEIQDLTDLWKVDILSPLLDDTDVGILSFQDLIRTEDFSWQKNFLSNVSFVTIIEASDILAGGQEMVMDIAARIGSEVQNTTWLLCDRNAESMLDLFSHLLDRQFRYVSAIPHPAKEAVIAYWDTEIETARTWDPAQRYLGTEARLIELAGAENIESVEWYGEEIMPIYDLLWVYGQYYQEYGQRIGKKAHQVLLNRIMQFSIDGNASIKEKEKYLIVEDYCFNLYEIGRQYATRAENRAFVNVMSPRYMFRDFMKYHAEIMKADAKYLSQFVPEHVNSKRNVALRLIRKMLESSVSEEKIREMLQKSEEKMEDTIGVLTLQNIIRLMFPEIKDAEIAVTYRSEFSDRDGNIHMMNYYNIIDDRVRKGFRKYFSQACYLDEMGNRKHIDRMMMAGHLDQKYLEGQFVVFGGKYYEVSKSIITDREQALVVKRASEQMTGRKYYRQLRRYSVQKDYLEGKIQEKIIWRQNEIVVKRCWMDLNAYTYGYVKMDEWNGICQGESVYFNYEMEKERKYSEKQTLKIEMPGVTPESTLPIWLAAMLYESFCTFYPQYYHLLSVAVNRKDWNGKKLPKAVTDVVLSHIDADTSKCFYIIEDCREDIGLLRSIERNFQKILEILTRYVAWSKEVNDDYFNY